MHEEKLKKLKQYFKEEFQNPKDIILFFIPIIIAFILIIPVPYTVTVGGGTINMDKKIDVEQSFISKGSFNSAYVKELKGRVITYLMAKIIPSYELNPLSSVTLEGESEKEYSYREKTYFNSSLDSATILAYKKANEKIDIIKEEVYVMYILENAKTSLEVGDQILEINNIKVSNIEDINDILKTLNYGDNVNVKVLSDSKEVNRYFEVLNIGNEKKIGISISTKYIYEVERKIDFDFSNKESGPSGGLIMTLSIYNKLIENDITKGRVIVGTGTIDIEGNVGEIGGVKEKLQGAVKKKADIFLVPYENYEEANALKIKENYDIKIIKVKTFDEAIEKLK